MKSLLLLAVMAAGCAGSEALGDIEPVELSSEDICKGCVWVPETEVEERGHEYGGLLVAVDGAAADAPLFVEVGVYDSDLSTSIGEFVVEVPKGSPRVAFGHFPFAGATQYALAQELYLDRQLVTQASGWAAATPAVDLRVPSELVSANDVGGHYYFDYVDLQLLQP